MRGTLDWLPHSLPTRTPTGPLMQAHALTQNGTCSLIGSEASAQPAEPHQPELRSLSTLQMCKSYQPMGMAVSGPSEVVSTSSKNVCNLCTLKFKDSKLLMSCLLLMQKPYRSEITLRVLVAI